MTSLNYWLGKTKYFKWFCQDSPSLPFISQMFKCNGLPARYDAILTYFHRFNQALYTFCPNPVFPKIYP